MPQVPQGVKISSIIFYVFAGIALLGMCASIVLNGMALAAAGGDETLVTSSGINIGIGACVGILVTALYGFVGYSLSKLQKWSRIAAIVLGVLLLCGFPIGTIGGGVVLYYMFQQDVQQAFA